MSDETAQRLAEVTAQEATQRAVVDRMKQETLDEIASGMWVRLEGIAKQIALAQPEVTKTLGKAGVADLRKEVAFGAETLAYEVRGAADSIKWPTRSYRQRNTVASSVSDFLYGRRMTVLDRVFRQRGYHVEQHAGLSPYQLFDQQAYDDLDREFTKLHTLTAQVEVAKKENDGDDAAAIWDNSQP